jgi:lysophospholipase L1-like esterase
VLDNLIRYEQELYRLKPHVILLLQGHNDLYEMLQPAMSADPDAPSEVSTFTPWGRWLERHSLLYGKGIVIVRSLWRSFREDPVARTDEEVHAALDRGLAQFETDVRAYVAVAHAMGAQVALVEPPNISGARGSVDGPGIERWRSAFGAVEPSAVLEGYARERAVLQHVAAVTGALYLSTAGLGLDSLRFYEAGDPIHLNDAGARLLADGLSRTIRPMLSGPAVCRSRITPDTEGAAPKPQPGGCDSSLTCCH